MRNNEIQRKKCAVFKFCFEWSVMVSLSHISSIVFIQKKYYQNYVFVNFLTTGRRFHRNKKMSTYVFIEGHGFFSFSNITVYILQQLEYSEQAYWRSQNKCCNSSMHLQNRISTLRELPQNCKMLLMFVPFNFDANFCKLFLLL